MTRNRKRQRKTAVRAATPPAPSVNPISKIVSSSATPVEANTIDKRQSRVVAHQTQTFHGPIPHPDIFRQYGEVIPDAPERILRVFEEDSKHARDIQLAALEAQKKDNHRVHWMAWSLIAGGYLLSGVFAWVGKDELAGLVLAGTLAGTITGFIQNHRAGKTDKK